MNRVFFALGLAFTFGCEPGPKRDNAAKPIDDAPKVEAASVAGPRPASTSAAARQAVAELLGAHTKGEPSLLAAFRNCTVKRGGEMNQGGSMLAAECVERLAWPGQFRGDWTQPGVMSIFANGETVLFYAPQAGRSQPTPLSAADTASNLEDIRATWLTLLVPLLGENVTAEIVPDSKALRVWIGSQPPHVLMIDSKTGLLVKVLFEKVNDGRRETWAFALSDHKLTNGVLLPGKMTFSAGPRIGAVWQAIEYSPNAAFKEGTFEKP